MIRPVPERRDQRADLEPRDHQAVDRADRSRDGKHQQRRPAASSPGSPRMMNEASTAPTLIRLPTDRSIEPHRMTSVCPSATVPSADHALQQADEPAGVELVERARPDRRADVERRRAAETAAAGIGRRAPATDAAERAAGSCRGSCAGGRDDRPRAPSPPPPSRRRGSSPAMRPSCITTMRSLTPITSGRSEEIIRMPRPRAGEIAHDARRSPPWRRRRCRGSARRRSGAAGRARASAR